MPFSPDDSFLLLLDIKATLSKHVTLLEGIDERLGKISDDGKGGTGLAGETRRNTTRLDGYDRLKWMALGIMGVIGVGFGVVKDWAASLPSFLGLQQ